jgi:pimeloyl-ACP methyl ester carboxylesterase
VLFIHGGFGGVESTLFPQRSVFSGVLPSENFRTVTYDRRNSSRSGYSTKPYRVDDLAADARGLLDHLSIEHAVIVGDSLGGQVAMLFAARWPELVNCLVLAETAPHIVRGTRFSKSVLLASRFVPHRLIFRLARQRVLNPPEYDPVGPQTAETLEARRVRRAAYLAKLRTMPQDDLFRYSIGLLHSYAAFMGRDVSDRLSDLKMPVHILHGTADRVVPFRAGELLKQLIPASALHPMEGAGHGLFYYEPARALMRDILDGYGS